MYVKISTICWFLFCFIGWRYWRFCCYFSRLKLKKWTTLCQLHRAQLQFESTWAFWNTLVPEQYSLFPLDIVRYKCGFTPVRIYTCVYLNQCGFTPMRIYKPRGFTPTAEKQPREFTPTAKKHLRGKTSARIYKPRGKTSARIYKPRVFTPTAEKHLRVLAFTPFICLFLLHRYYLKKKKIGTFNFY